MCQKNQKIYVWIKVFGVNKIVATSADRKWDVFFLYDDFARELFFCNNHKPSQVD
jgi:hypothetical protein